MTSLSSFAELVSSLDDEFAELSLSVAERRCREELGFGTYAEAAARFGRNPPCPNCGDPRPFEDGFTSLGLQRYRRRSCGRRLNSLSGTVLEQSREEVPDWADFVRLMTFNVPLDAAEICRISHRTAFEWKHRVFATVDGYQDRIVLRNRIWIDEAYVVDTDLTRGYGQARKRGLSKQQMCIAIAIDVHKNLVAVVCGHGKPSSKRMKDGLLKHIAEGSAIVHDMEKAHNTLMKAARCTSESYKADTRDPVYLECLSMVNNLCS